MADEQTPGGTQGGSSQAPLPEPGKPAAPPAKPAAPAGHGAPPKPPATMAATSWDSDLARELKERFGDRISETSSYLGQNFIIARPEAAISVLEYLKLEADFDYLVDVTA